MSTLEPLINLIIVLTVLSVAAERFTNLLELQHPELREKTASEKEREHRVMWLSLLVGIGSSLLMNANKLELLTQLDTPWDL